MKKCLFAMALAIIFGLSAGAQTVEHSKFTDNWQIGVRGGVSALAHPGCNGYEDFGHTIEATTTLGLTKYITPVFGVGIEGQVMWENGSRYGMFQGRNWLNNVNVLANSKFNLSNLFGGYNGLPRKVEFVAVAGIGWAHGFVYPLEGDEYYVGTAHTNDIMTRYAVEVNYNINDRIQLNLVPQLAYNLTQSRNYYHYNSPVFDSRNMWYGLEAGITYKFKNSNGEHNFTLCPYSYTQADIDALTNEINELRARGPEYVEKVVYHDVVKTVKTGEYTIEFAQGSSELNDAAKSKLNGIEKGTSVTLVGKASPEGTTKFNQTLSEKRVNAVADYLSGRGVKIAGKRAIGESDGPTSNRIVIVDVE